MTLPMRRSLRDYLADPGHWAGWNPDPAEVTSPTAWLYIGRLRIYIWLEPR